MGNLEVAEDEPPKPVNLSVGNVTAAPGQAGVSVTIDVDSAEGIAGGALTLNYDPSVLTARSASATSLLSSAGMATVFDLNTPGEARFFIFGDLGIESGSGDLITVTFDVKSTAAAGSYALELINPELLTEFEEAIQLQSTDIGLFTIGGGPPIGGGGGQVSSVHLSDFNKDGTVNFDDFFEFAANFGKTQEDADFNPKYDLTIDGAVNFDDFFKFAENFGREVEHEDIPLVAGNESVFLVRKALVGVGTMDPYLPVVAFHEDGDWFGAITDEFGKPEGAVYTTKDGATFTTWVGNDGLPIRSSMSGFTYLFGNYGKDSVDVAVIAPDDTKGIHRVQMDLSGFESLNLDGNTAGKGVTYQVGSIEERRLRQEVLKFAGVALSVTGCALSIPAAFITAGALTPAVAVACGAASLSVGAYIAEESVVLQQSNVAVGGISSAIGCGTGSLTSCASIIVGAVEQRENSKLRTLELIQSFKKLRLEIDKENEELDRFLELAADFEARSGLEDGEEPTDVDTTGVLQTPGITKVEPTSLLKGRFRVLTIEGVSLQFTSGATIDLPGIVEIVEISESGDFVKVQVTIPTSQSAESVILTLNSTTGINFPIQLALKEGKLVGAILQLEGTRDSGWQLPAKVNISGLTPGNEQLSERGSPILSNIVDGDADYFTAFRVSNFPRRIGTSVLSGNSNRRGRSSFIAIKNVGSENEKVWINASVGIQTFGEFSNRNWEYQIRFFRDVQNNISIMEIGSVPNSGFWGRVVPIPSHSVELLFE